MAAQVEFIKSIPYFSGLGQAELDSICKFVFERKADRGEILLFEDEPAETLCFVVAGAVKVFALLRNSTALATAAQWALNLALNANPIGLVVTAVGALIPRHSLKNLFTSSTNLGLDASAKGSSLS